MKNKYIKIKYFKTLLLLVLPVLLSVSCTKEQRSEIIIKELNEDTTQTQSEPAAHNEYRYVIN